MSASNTIIIDQIYPKLIPGELYRATMGCNSFTMHSFNKVTGMYATCRLSKRDILLYLYTTVGYHPKNSKSKTENVDIFDVFLYKKHIVISYARIIFNNDHNHYKRYYYGTTIESPIIEYHQVST